MRIPHEWSHCTPLANQAPPTSEKRGAQGHLSLPPQLSVHFISRWLRIQLDLVKGNIHTPTNTDTQTHTDKCDTKSHTFSHKRERTFVKESSGVSIPKERILTATPPTCPLTCPHSVVCMQGLFSFHLEHPHKSTSYAFPRCHGRTLFPPHPKQGLGLCQCVFLRVPPLTLAPQPGIICMHLSPRFSVSEDHVAHGVQEGREVCV